MGTIYIISQYKPYCHSGLDPESILIDPESADFGGRETPIVSKTTFLRTADNPRQVQGDRAS
ncbi:MAG: hypothetical protein LBK53_03475 [Heliobacteriaceae bacterium]|nr:hypothetical protein [Heliobacteriaceae bacterium]